MFTQCVIGDPANPIYTKSFLDNLFRKYENNKKGSRMASLSGAGVMGSIKKATFSKDWEGVIKSGLEMLKLNPWHVSSLTAIAQACEELKFDECQLLYLKAALDANPKDVEVNRICGKALGRLGHFDQAIACWARVQQIKPGDEEANKNIGDLHVNKTMSHGGYDEATTSVDVRGDKAGKGTKGDSQVQETSLTPEQKFERAIAKSPSEVNNYIELAEIHTRNDKFVESEAILTKALQVSGGDVNKKVGTLSGGEAARVIFARIMAEKSNVLVLDEPTNHLDMESIEALAEGLKAYEGTLFFVSHDRAFVSALATRIVEVTEDGFRDRPGTYADYLASAGDDHLDVETVVLKAKKPKKAS